MWLSYISNDPWVQFAFVAGAAACIVVWQFLHFFGRVDEIQRPAREEAAQARKNAQDYLSENYKLQAKVNELTNKVVELTPKVVKK